MHNSRTNSDTYQFFDRDLSWLSFNERVLMEAQNESIPVLERINFLSIFSSNLDEFYRVRIPALAALNRLHEKVKLNEQVALTYPDVWRQVNEVIQGHQALLGRVLTPILERLKKEGIIVLLNQQPPAELHPEVKHYFYTHVMGLLKPVNLQELTTFHPENNQLYLAARRVIKKKTSVVIVNIPSSQLPRFFIAPHHHQHYVIFLDDIIRMNLSALGNIEAKTIFSFKVTRNAEIDFNDGYEDDVLGLIEKQITKRDRALATRFLYDPTAPADVLATLLEDLGLSQTLIVPGGRYHNLKDLRAGLNSLPLPRYPVVKPVARVGPSSQRLLDQIAERDLLVHTPYHSFDVVLQFFNEAAFFEDVESIYLTIYRVANDSRILQALMSAAQNGKKVIVLIELKARFDEENNIKWARRLKQAGVEVRYTKHELKVHAKVALLKLKGKKQYRGLLSTGNLNENSARIYTDHILLTSDNRLLQELNNVFKLFEKGVSILPGLKFEHLLVAQYNLQDRFLKLIDQEISNARAGLPAAIILKMNNLEERVLIKKLYDASAAGVRIELIVRSICCLIPGVAGMSENIRVRRIVDRYLEHGRIFVFHNNGEQKVFLGSADWMNRNIYKRIEVCFPILDEELKTELLQIVDAQLSDNCQAVLLDSQLRNQFMDSGVSKIRSQVVIQEQCSNSRLHQQ